MEQIAIAMAMAVAMAIAMAVDGTDAERMYSLNMRGGGRRNILCPPTHTDASAVLAEHTGGRLTKYSMSTAEYFTGE